MPLSDFDIAGGSVFSHTSAVFVFFSCLLWDRSTLALMLVLMPLSDVDVACGSVFLGTSPALVVFFNCPLRGRSTLALALVLTPVATFFFFFFLFVVETSAPIRQNRDINLWRQIHLMFSSIGQRNTPSRRPRDVGRLANPVSTEVWRKHKKREKANLLQNTEFERRISTLP